jgi:hypothetical protein
MRLLLIRHVDSVSVTLTVISGNNLYYMQI